MPGRTTAHARARRRCLLASEGVGAAAIVDGDGLEIKVNCRADAGALEDAVPYALAVTLEADESIAVDIYAEVEVRVRQQVQVTPLA